MDTTNQLTLKGTLESPASVSDVYDATTPPATPRNLDFFFTDDYHRCVDEELLSRGYDLTAIDSMSIDRVDALLLDQQAQSLNGVPEPSPPEVEVPLPDLDELTARQQQRLRKRHGCSPVSVVPYATVEPLTVYQYPTDVPSFQLTDEEITSWSDGFDLYCDSITVPEPIIRQPSPMALCSAKIRSACGVTKDGHVSPPKQRQRPEKKRSRADSTLRADRPAKIIVPQDSHKTPRRPDDQIYRISNSDYHEVAGILSEMSIKHRDNHVIVSACKSAWNELHKRRDKRRHSSRDAKMSARTIAPDEIQDQSAFTTWIKAYGSYYLRKLADYCGPAGAETQDLFKGFDAMVGDVHPTLKEVLAASYKACMSIYRYAVDLIEDIRKTLDCPKEVYYPLILVILTSLYHCTDSYVCLAAIAIVAACIMRDVANLVVDLLPRFVAWIKEATDMMSAPIQNQSHGTLSKALIDIVCVCFLACCGVTSVCKKGTEGLINTVSKFTNFRKSAHDLIGTIVEWSQSFISVIATWVTGSEDLALSWFTAPKVRDLLVRGNAFLDHAKLHNEATLSQFQVLSVLISDLDKFVLDKEFKLIAVSQQGLVTRMLQQLRDNLPRFTAFTTNNSHRIEPVCIYIYSRPGRGKSTALNFLQCGILARLLPEISITDLLDHRQSYIYPRKIKNDFWSGYTNQPMVLYDDIGQLNDKLSGMSEFMEIIENVNSFQNHLHAAEISLKASMFMKALVVMCTSNLRAPVAETIRDLEAVYRRLHFCVEQAVKPQWAKDNGMVDIEKMSQVSDEEYPEAFEYREYTIARNGKVSYTGKVYDIWSLIEAVCARYAEHSRIHEAVSRSCKVVVDRIRSASGTHAPTINPELINKPMVTDQAHKKGFVAGLLERVRGKPKPTVPSGLTELLDRMQNASWDKQDYRKWIADTMESELSVTEKRRALLSRLADSNEPGEIEDLQIFISSLDWEHGHQIQDQAPPLPQSPVTVIENDGAVIQVPFQIQDQSFTIPNDDEIERYLMVSNLGKYNESFAVHPRSQFAGEVAPLPNCPGIGPCCTAYPHVDDPTIQVESHHVCWLREAQVAGILPRIHPDDFQITGQISKYSSLVYNARLAPISADGVVCAAKYLTSIGFDPYESNSDFIIRQRRLVVFYCCLLSSKPMPDFWKLPQDWMTEQPIESSCTMTGLCPHCVQKMMECFALSRSSGYKHFNDFKKSWFFSPTPCLLFAETVTKNRPIATRERFEYYIKRVLKFISHPAFLVGLGTIAVAVGGFYAWNRSQKKRISDQSTDKDFRKAMRNLRVGQMNASHATSMLPVVPPAVPIVNQSLDVDAIEAVRSSIYTILDENDVAWGRAFCVKDTIFVTAKHVMQKVCASLPKGSMLKLRQEGPKGFVHEYPLSDMAECLRACSSVRDARDVAAFTIVTVSLPSGRDRSRMLSSGHYTTDSGIISTYAYKWTSSGYGVPVVNDAYSVPGPENGGVGWYAHNLNSVAGESGRPLFANLSGGSRFIGVLKGDGRGATMYTPIDKTFIDQLVAALAKIKLGPIYQCDDSEIINHSLDGAPGVYTGVLQPNYFTPNISQIQSSDISDCLDIPIEDAPAAMGWYEKDGELWHPFFEESANWPRETKYLNVELVAVIHDNAILKTEKAIATSCDPALKSHNFKRLLTFEEAVSGWHDGYLKSIAADTCPGYPYILDPDKTKYGGRKFWMRDPANLDFNSPEMLALRKDVLSIVDAWKEGRRPTFYNVLFLKDELRSHEKVAAHKTRVIECGPFPLLLATRIVFGGYVAMWQAGRIVNGSAIGVNPYSQEWDVIARILFSEGHVFDGDVKGWNQCTPSGLFMGQILSIARWGGQDNFVCRMTAGQEFVYAKRLVPCPPPPPRHLQVKHGFDARNPDLWLTCPMARVIEPASGMPQGHLCTATFNTGGKCALIDIGYSAVIGEVNFQRLNKEIGKIALGDDHVVRSTHDGFNALRYNNFLKCLGVSYTDASKCEVSAMWTHPIDVTFLKRKFRYEEKVERFVAPLQINSIARSLHWCGPKTSRSELSERSKMALLEASLHDEKTYEDFYSKLDQAWQHVAPRFAPPWTPHYSAIKQACGLSSEM